MNETLTYNDDTSSQDLESGADNESLRNQYSEGTSARDKSVKELMEKLEPIVQHVEDNMRSEADKRIQDSVDEAVKSLKEDDSLEKVSDSLVEGFLQNQYTKNPDFKTAYDNRQKSPDSWDKALVGAREKLTEEIQSLTGSNVKDDVAAALATVHGQSETEVKDADTVSAKKLFSMTDIEFKAHKEALDET